ncbi:MAG: phytoene desaturase family protein [Nocardioidaceae bacterium]
MTSDEAERYDVVVIGGGHNGLTAAAYLARAGLDVLVLERLAHLGGAATSSPAFPGMPARFSRFADLVSGLPDRIAADLELDLELRSRATASYVPTIREGKPTALVVEARPGARTATSFKALTGSDLEFDAWEEFYGETSAFSEALAPTLLEPLRTAKEMRDLVDPATWAALVEEPLGVVLEDRFHDDAVRGLIASEAVRGTFADLHDPSLAQNRGYLHHLLGNGSGEWRVPIGGMGAVTSALSVAARNAGATFLTGAGVSGIESDGKSARVTWHDGDGWKSIECDWVLSNVAPWVLQVLLGDEPADRPEGSQIKVNMLLEGLPRLRSGATAAEAFSGTMHVAEGYQEINAAFADAMAGRLPTVQPGELICHSLTDPSILGPLAVKGLHALTYFGVHTPARLFEGDVEGQRDIAVARFLDAINVYLDEPLEALLAIDSHGRPCLEAMAPQDLDQALAMPGGHIFHGDLSWPWAANRGRLETAAQRWGVSTDKDNVLLCGAGARRGGGITGVGGHNAAHAILETRSSPA